MRNAVRQASNAYNTAADVGAGLGAEAGGINASLTPFLTQEMLHPQGVGQTGLAAEQAAANAGAGGATSGIVGQAAQRAAVSRNAGGFQAALDDAARSRAKAAAGSSEGIVAANEQLKQQQAEQGSEGLGKMYGVDTSGMLNAMGQEHEDINSELEAAKTPEPWMTTTNELLKLGGSAAGLLGGFKIPGFGGFAPK